MADYLFARRCTDADRDPSLLRARSRPSRIRPRAARYEWCAALAGGLASLNQIAESFVLGAPRITSRSVASLPDFDEPRSSTWGTAGGTIGELTTSGRQLPLRCPSGGIAKLLTESKTLE
jgi:hypothetical protein